MQSKEYLAHPGMRQSNLKFILDGVDEYRHRISTPWKQTPEQILGTAVHLLVLQPELMHTVAKVPDIDAGTRLGKIFNHLAEGRDLSFFPIARTKTKRPGKGLFYEVDEAEFDYAQTALAEYGHIFKAPADYLMLSESVHKAAHHMAANIRDNTDARALLSDCTSFEAETYFEFNGIQFKCATDAQGKRFTLDLKTTIIKNDDYEIDREIRKRKYHFQAALYLLRTGRTDMFDDEGNFVDHYYIIWVRNVAPYTVFPIRMRPALLREGLEQVIWACNLYKDCLINNPNFIADNRLRTV